MTRATSCAPMSVSLQSQLRDDRAYCRLPRPVLDSLGSLTEGPGHVWIAHTYPRGISPAMRFMLARGLDPAARSQRSNRPCMTAPGSSALSSERIATSFGKASSTSRPRSCVAKGREQWAVSLASAYLQCWVAPADL